MNTLKDYSVCISRHSVGVILIRFHDVFISWSKGDAPLSVVSEESLFVLGLLAEANPLVIALEGLNVILSD